MSPAEAVALVWFVADQYREQLLRQAEREFRASGFGVWREYVAEDTAALGQWRADWALAVGPS